MTWICELGCGPIDGADWAGLDNHVRLMHPDVDRDARDAEGELVVDVTDRADHRCPTSRSSPHSHRRHHASTPMP